MSWSFVRDEPAVEIELVLEVLVEAPLRDLGALRDLREGRFCISAFGELGDRLPHKTVTPLGGEREECFRRHVTGQSYDRSVTCTRGYRIERAVGDIVPNHTRPGRSLPPANRKNRAPHEVAKTNPWDRRRMPNPPPTFGILGQTSEVPPVTSATAVPTRIGHSQTASGNSVGCGSIAAA